ncbi:MAG: ribonuclease H family protein, partial [Alphaproteobacteria bacterium]
MRVYTDASSRGSISGIAFVATNSRDKEVYKKGMVIEKGDNNTAELTAILYALDFVRDKTDHKVVIFTDSSYAINAIRNGNFRETERTLVESIQQSMAELGSTLFWV